MYYSNDPAADYDRYCAEEQRYIDSLPKCSECGETIEDYVFDIDGEILCYDCLCEKYRHDAEKYIEED